MRKFSYLLSLLLIFLIPSENVVVVKGIGTISKITGILAAGVWFLSIAKIGHHRKFQRFHLAVLLYFFWQMLGYFWSIDQASTLSRIITNFQLLIMIAIFWDLYRTPEELKAGLQAYVLGAYVSIGSIVTRYVLTKGLYTIVRYRATGFGPNDLALILALGIPVAWHLAIYRGNDQQNRILRFINFAYIPAAAFSILLTASRGGVFAMVFAFPFIVWSITRLGFFQRIVIIAALMGSALFLQSQVPSSSIARVSAIESSIFEGELNERIAIWQAGWKSFSEHPVNGIGAGGYSRLYTKNSIGLVAHNSFLSVLVESGLVGFGLFIIILTIIGKEAMNQQVHYSRLWLTVLSVWSVGAMALSWEHRKQTWLFMAFVIISAKVVNSSEQDGAIKTDTVIGQRSIDASGKGV